jgi:hypothetical protein
MTELVQVKAEIPRELKRQVFSLFALREEKFNRWLQRQMEIWLQQEGTAKDRNDERLVGS